MFRTLTAIIYWEEDVYVAECPEVGTASQGETVEEAIADLHLEEFPNYQPCRLALTTRQSQKLIQYQKQC